MDLFATKFIDWMLLVFLVILRSNYGAFYVSTSTDQSPNFLKVLNTSRPLFLLLWAPKVSTNENCKGYDCMKQTETCEHMRRQNMDRYEYNHTVSKYKEKTWLNDTLMGRFYLGEPPVIMNVYNISGPIPVPFVHSYCMKLIYSEPQTHNCSVVIIAEDPSLKCDETKAEVHKSSKCAIYARGRLPQGVYAPPECQKAFNNCTHSKVIYMPYSPRCAAQVPDENGESYRYSY
uniref:Putative secreted peptide n=1 Tax=Rhipicephalus pulchellus TaxID=72859 RepID=L7M9S4_RHIPC